MSMTPEQAKQLGTLISEARYRKGWGLRLVAERLGVSFSWLGKVERGEHASIPPDRLARLAELLEIAPSRLDRLTKGSVARSLPEVRTYFRAKYGLTREQAREIEAYTKRYIEPPKEDAA